VCAGQNEPSKFGTEKYDPVENTWTEIPNMNFYSDNLNAEVIDDMIFVIGSNYEPNEFFSRVACFNDKENRWFVCLFASL
jgi:hypothetical protein